MHITDIQPPKPRFARTPATPRFVRAPEYWEHPREVFPAATVLDDLESFPADPQAVRWIIVRYAAVRAVAGLFAPEIDAQELRVERNVGLNHVLVLPMLDREAWSLRRALEALTDTPSPALVEALLRAGAGAEQRGHVRGAFAIYYIVYRLAHRERWPAEAASAARGVERLARAAGASYAPRLWRRRARVMEKKAAVA